jgi:hypothetical protein
MSVFGGLVSMMLASLVGSTSAGKQPIYLTEEGVSGGVRLRVIGDANAPYAASFLLEVNGSTGNQSRHQGSARLQPGDTVTLSSTTFSVPADGQWHARLRVEPSGAEAYEQILASD